MKRLVLILAVLFFSARLPAEEAADSRITLFETVEIMSHVKASCFAEWSDWRNVDKEKLNAFQRAVTDSLIFNDNPDIRHNMLVLANGLVVAQGAFEKTVAEYNAMLEKQYTPAELHGKSPEAHRAGRLRAIKSKWSQIQNDYSAAVQVQLNAMKRLSTATSEKTIQRNDPIFTAAAALENSNIAQKTRTDLMANATDLHFIIVDVRPEGVIAHPRDEDEKIRGKIIYSRSFIFVTGVENPAKDRKVVCTATSDGTIQHPGTANPYEIERWRAIDTKDETD